MSGVGADHESSRKATKELEQPSDEKAPSFDEALICLARPAGLEPTTISFSYLQPLPPLTSTHTRRGPMSATAPERTSCPSCIARVGECTCGRIGERQRASANLC